MVRVPVSSVARRLTSAVFVAAAIARAGQAQSLTVNPKGATDTTRVASSSFTFQTLLVGASGADTAQLTLQCSGAVTSCSFPNTGQFLVAAIPSGQANWPVNFQVVPGGGTGTIKFKVATTRAPTLSDSATLAVVYIVPIYGATLTVSPDTVIVTPGQDVFTTFTMTNTGNVLDTLQDGSFTFNACSGAGISWCGGTSTPGGQVFLKPDSSGTVQTQWNAGPAGTTGTVRVSVVDAHGVALSAVQTVLVQRAIGLDLVDASPGVSLDRGHCLTIEMAPRAAMECEALRITHPLPAVRTYNTTKVPTLIYNWDFSQPTVRVGAYLTISTSGATLDSVEGRLYRRPHESTNAPTMASSGSWPGGTDWAGTGSVVTRRIELYWQATDTSGLYDIAFATSRFYHRAGGADSVVQDSSSEQVINVNRMASPYGAGWWLVGLEQIWSFGPGTRPDTIAWIGGDGSTNLYVDSARAGIVWKPVTIVAARDSIMWSTTAGMYERMAPHHYRVSFVNGHTNYRINRLGDSTRFHYTTPTSLSVDTIAVATPGGDGNANTRGWYTFIYNAGVLQQVKAPGPQGPGTRPVTFYDSTTYGWASPSIWKITDPDGYSVTFNRDPNALLRYVVRTDKRGNATTLGYGIDVQGFGYSDTKLNQSGVSDIVRTVTALSNFGLSASWLPSGSIHALDPARAYFVYSGPRSNATVGHDSSDVTTIWVDKYWQPTMIQDAYGAITRIRRDNPTYPTRITQTEAPYSKVGTATYDARGNIASVTDLSTYRHGAYATTTYRWDPRWDQIQLIDPPMQDSLSFVYDTIWGNRQSQTNANGNAITYSYGANNLLASTTLPGTQPDLVLYDPVLQNVMATRTPKGYWSLYRTDVLGRDSVAIAPTDSTSAKDSVAVQSAGVVATHLYDANDRDIIVTTTGQAMNGVGAQTITVDNTYDAEGDLIAVARLGSVSGTLNTSSGYDPARRKVFDVATDGDTTKIIYDAGSNPTQVTTRRGNTITTAYDRLNRSVQRITSATSYTTWTQGIPSAPDQPPGGAQYAAPYGGLTIAGDTATFVYDSANRMIEADNGDAHVSRTYFANDLLASETQRVRTLSGTDFTQHIYSIGYHYNLDGKRDTLYLPPVLLHNTNGGFLTGSESYAYDKVGRIDTVIDPNRNAYHYGYNARGDQDTIAYSVGPLDVRTFDDDGNLVAETLAGLSSAGGGYLRNVNRWFDARGKLTHSVNHLGLGDTVYVYYSGLGYVVSDSTRWHGVDGVGDAESVHDQNQFTYDALGNQLTNNAGATSVINGSAFDLYVQHENWNYASPSGRLRSGVYQGGDPNDGLADTTWYDASGNVYFTTQEPATYNNNTVLKDRASYYDAAERLRQVDYRVLSNLLVLYKTFAVDSEAYRYDALGRKVLMHTRQFCETGTQVLQSPCNWSWVWRAVFDGNEELAEVETPDTSPEADTLPFQYALGFNGADENYKFGRVLYTLGLDVDKPLAVTRIDNADNENNYFLFPPFSYIPIWNGRGQYDVVDIPVCPDSIGGPRCPKWSTQQDLMTYYTVPLQILAWMGSELEGRADASGTVDQRARTYDPHTGRFTQEDPLGLGGGLNDYGFAAGDPINYSDPFGLCPSCGEGLFFALSTSEDYKMAVAQARYDASMQLMSKVVTVMGVLSGAGGLAKSAVSSGARVAESNEAVVVAGETRVSRWMGEAEADKMQASGTLQESRSGPTYVTKLGAPRPGGTGPVRMDFNVPSEAVDWNLANTDWGAIRFPGRSPPPVNTIMRVTP